MALLTDAVRQLIWRLGMRKASYTVKLDLLVPGTIQKSDWLAAIVAADTWLENNAIAYNNALPATYRTAATTAQKAALLAMVANARAPGMVEVSE